MDSRRDFLKKTGFAASAFVFGSIACNDGTKTEEQKVDSAGKASSSTPTEKSVGDFGVQLYSLRDDMPKIQRED